MSKRISRFLALMVAVALAAAGIALDPSSWAQRASVATTSRSAAIVAATTEVLKETSEIRELAILRPVKSGAQSRAEIERMLVKKLNEQTTSDEMHATEQTLKKFGLAPVGFQYRPFLIKLLTEQVAGYYDSRPREFHLADWIELEGQKPVMAHELTHALQDQHFNLQRFEKWPKGDSDAELATHALIEGDATLAMTVYMARNPLVALAFSRSLKVGTVASEQYNQAPRAIRESLVFPYLQGMEWATAIYKRGGWKLVSDAYAKLPLSTEQILHPEKYFSYERPVMVRLPDLEKLLNTGNNKAAVSAKQQPALVGHHSGDSRPESPAQSKGTTARPAPGVRSLPRSATRNSERGTWRRIGHDVNGEWGYYLILDQLLNSPNESRRAAAGWAGDRYAVYELTEGGQSLLVHVSEWDTQQDAEEFFDAYVKRSLLRYPNAKDLSDAQPAVSERFRRLATAEGEVLMELRGQRVLILEGVPLGVDSNALVKALWQ